MKKYTVEMHDDDGRGRCRYCVDVEAANRRAARVAAVARWHELTGICADVVSVRRAPRPRVSFVVYSRLFGVKAATTHRSPAAALRACSRRTGPGWHVIDTTGQRWTLDAAGTPTTAQG